MEIIKQGNKHKHWLNWTSEIVCSKCESVLLISLSDLKTYEYGGYGYDENSVYTGYKVICEVCGNSIVPKIPEDVKNNLRK